MKGHVRYAVDVSYYIPPHNNHVVEHTLVEANNAQEAVEEIKRRYAAYRKVEIISIAHVRATST